VRWIRELGVVAAECLRKPKHASVWDQGSQQYVSSDDPRFLTIKRDDPAAAFAPINAGFKLVFHGVVGATMFFMAACIVLTLIARKEMPDLISELHSGLLDLVKIGFGAVVGLLGGQRLQGSPSRPRAHTHQHTKSAPRP